MAVFEGKEKVLAHSNDRYIIIVGIDFGFRWR